MCVSWFVGKHCGCIPPCYLFVCSVVFWVRPPQLIVCSFCSVTLQVRPPPLFVTLIPIPRHCTGLFVAFFKYILLFTILKYQSRGVLVPTQHLKTQEKSNRYTNATFRQLKEVRECYKFRQEWVKKEPRIKLPGKN